MKKIFAFFGVICLMASAGFAQSDASLPMVRKAVYFDVSPPLRDMVKNLPALADNSWKDGIVKNHIYPYGMPVEDQSTPVNDPNVQRWFGRSITDTTLANFDGNTNTQGYYPPDTHGEAGLNHYFQVVNCHYAIYDKTGTKLFGPSNNNSIWSGMPNNSNDGDAIVLYDENADRWLFTQFSLPSYPNGPFYQMIAVSQTGDPTGSWYRYQYSYSDLGDYPKFGIWPDGYYMTVNRFSSGSSSYKGTATVAFERTKMLTGDPGAQSVMFTLPSSNEAYAMLPSDCDGAFPPLGTPAYIAYQSSNHIRIYEFHVDWTTTANSTFTQGVTLPVNPYNGTINGIPQMGTSKTLDAISGRIMTRLPFRKFSDHWSMAASGTVNVGSGVAGIRWYELRNTGTGWSIYQQGTYSPDSHSRWMGSIAMDSLGNMAVGYSISSSTMYPSVRYTGRLAGDPLGEMTIGEHGIINGSGYQTYSGTSPLRWGDYSDMCVDPSAPSTFWYTQMYYASNGSNWRTRIASFSLANIFGVDATAVPEAICAGQSSQLNVAATGGSGTYTYSWSSIPAGFTSTIQNPLVNPTVTTQYIATVFDGTSTKRDTATVTVNSQPTADAGPDATYPNTTPLFPVSGTATSFSRVKWLTNGDGHFNFDTVQASLYYPGPLDKNHGGVDLTFKAYPIGTCTDTATDVVHITLTFPAGINDPTTNGFSMAITPNPASGIFTLLLRGMMNTKAQIEICDLAGKKMFLENIVSSSQEMKKEINAAGFPKGIYLVRVQTEQHSMTKKLVIQ